MTEGSRTWLPDASATAPGLVTRAAHHGLPLCAGPPDGGRARPAVCRRQRDTGSPRLSSAAMADRDGNGWIRCAQGHRHWGRFGAAGLLAYAPAAAGDAAVLLQRRSSWVNHPGTWGPPGGAMDSHESAVSAALREAAEECGVGRPGHRGRHPARRPRRLVVPDRDRRGPGPVPVRNASEATSEVRWISEGDIGRLDTHRGSPGSGHRCERRLPR